MATSAVPAAIDALVALLRADAGLNHARILDGPPAQNFTERDRVYIGWSPGSDAAAEMQQSFASAGARQRDEEASISCYIESHRGDTLVRNRRVCVFEMFAVIEAALRATSEEPTKPTLGNAVLWCEVAAGSLTQTQTDSGALAGLAFTVNFRARI